MANGCVKTTRSRQGYNLRCRFKLIIENDEDLKYTGQEKEKDDDYDPAKYLRGIFYAKLESPLMSNKEQVAGGFLIASDTMTISSVDDLSIIYENAQHGIYAKIYIEQFGRFYTVRDCQRDYTKQQLKLKKAQFVEAKYYLNLTESTDEL